MTCFVDNCDRPVRYRGLCNPHYLQASRGKPFTVPRSKGETVQARFWAKVDRSGECWTWTGSRNVKGYGRISMPGGVQNAHRVSWELANGPVPEGMFVCHRCDNPPCVRPDHLFTGTAMENTADMLRKGRWKKPGRAADMRMFTPEQEIAIHDAYEAGESQTAIGQRLGVSQSLIWQIVRVRMPSSRPPHARNRRTRASLSP